MALPCGVLGRGLAVRAECRKCTLVARPFLYSGAPPARESASESASGCTAKKKAITLICDVFYFNIDR
jgi:hypothetical protein